MGLCSAIFFNGESKIVEVKTKPGRSFKRYFKQTENALLFCKRFKMLTFSQFSSDILFEPQRHLTYVNIIFKTEGSKKFNFWKDFYFALSANYLFQRQATHVCLIYQYRSSYIIKPWPAWNFTLKNESIRAYYRSIPRESSIKRITRIVSQSLQKAKQLTATTSTSKTAMPQTIVDNRMRYAKKSPEERNPRNLARQHVWKKIHVVQAPMPILISQGKPPRTAWAKTATT